MLLFDFNFRRWISGQICIKQSLLKVFLKNRYEHHVTSSQSEHPALCYWLQSVLPCGVALSFLVTWSFTNLKFQPHSGALKHGKSLVIVVLFCSLYSYNFQIRLLCQKTHFLDFDYKKQIIIIKQVILKSTGLGKIKRHKSRVDFNYFLNIVILL